jgi:hypothetical protein
MAPASAWLGWSIAFPTKNETALAQTRLRIGFAQRIQPNANETNPLTLTLNG